MSSITSKPSTPEHLNDLQVRDHELNYIGLDNLAGLIAGSTSVTYFIEDKPVAIVGYIKVWPGTIEVFVIPDKRLKEHGYKVVRHLKKILTIMLEDLPIHRMQTDSLADDETDKWMRVLGFTCEGTMPYYTPEKHTYRRWGRYKA